MNTSAERGTCPHCGSTDVRHRVFGLPDFSYFCDTDGNVFEWVDLEGCLMPDEPTFNRNCERCRHQWNDDTDESDEL